MNTSLESEKDYISIKDVVKILPEISINGKDKLYNIASGKNIKTKKIVEIINKQFNNQIKINYTTKKIIFPIISIKKIMDEFEFEPTSVLDMLPNLINEFNTFLKKKE